MSTIISLPGRKAHPEPHPDAAARQRQNRLAKATVEDMASALAFLSVIDPEAFEIAFTAAISRDGEIPGHLRAPRPQRMRSPSRCAANAGPRSGSSSPMARGGSISAATASRPGTRRFTTRAILRRSPGSFPARTPKKSSQQPPDSRQALRERLPEGEAERTRGRAWAPGLDRLRHVQ